MKELVMFNDKQIRINDNEMFNLNDMWKANGSEENNDPRQWKRSPQAVKFCNTLQKKYNVGLSHIINSKRGRNGGTFAHWQLALVYAKYLSPEFHIWCNDIVKKFVNADISVAESVVERNNNVEDLERLKNRVEAKVSNISLNETISKVALVSEGHFPYSVSANHINKFATGMKAGELKKARDVKNARDGMTTKELASVTYAQCVSISNLDTKKAESGNEALGRIEKICNILKLAEELALNA